MIATNEKFLSRAKQVSATLVGAMSVGPCHWVCELRSVQSSWSMTCSDEDEPPPPTKRKKKKSPSGASKRRSNKGAQATEREWRKSAVGRALQQRLDERYHKTDKGQKTVKKHNAARKRPASALK